MTTYVLRYAADGKAHLVDKRFAPPPDSHSRSPYVMGDIQPFKSVVDGSVIGSRSDLRAHNRRNKCIDVGNDPALYRKPKPFEPDMNGIAQDVKRAMYEHGIEY